MQTNIRDSILFSPNSYYFYSCFHYQTHHEWGLGHRLGVGGSETLTLTTETDTHKQDVSTVHNMN